MYSKILVPFDGSDHARSALNHAKQIALANPQSTLEVVQVLATGHIGSEQAIHDEFILGQFNVVEYQKVLDAALEACRAAAVDEVGDVLAELGERASVKAISGTSPAAALVEHIKEGEFDLVVMGRRGLGSVRGMLGSVSFALLRECDVPVLTVK
jgi:nucleotide-binding universal stress UspA family protein